MTQKDFYKTVTNGTDDILQLLLEALNDLGIQYCVIGGLAVNAYAEPVVSLDLDIVIALESKVKLLGAVRDCLAIEEFSHSVHLTSKRSDVRIQIQTDPRYQEFIGRALPTQVMGYTLNVAALEDVLAGKVWAYLDETRRKSKRQKDLADILRLVETHPELMDILPGSVKSIL